MKQSLRGWNGKKLTRRRCAPERIGRCMNREPKTRSSVDFSVSFCRPKATLFCRFFRLPKTDRTGNRPDLFKKVFISLFLVTVTRTYLYAKAEKLTETDVHFRHKNEKPTEPCS